MAKDYIAKNGQKYRINNETANDPSWSYTVDDLTFKVPDENIWNFHRDEAKKIVNAIIEKGRPLTRDELADLSISRLQSNPNGPAAEKMWGWYMRFLDDNSDTLGYDSTVFGDDTYGKNISGAQLRTNIANSRPVVDPQTGALLDPNNEEDKAKIEEIKRNEARDIAYNNYWNNIYDRNRSDSLGQEAYNEMLAGEQAAGQSAIDLANAQVQQLGMAQAQTVKNITDQLRAERMSMLRAGMSESQIANQDMQQMIANTNALNDQIAASNMGVLQGQQQINNAQYTAYQNWLNSMNAVGTNASAMAAADAGDSYMQTLKRMKQTGETFGTSASHITGEYQSKTK